MPFQGYGLWLAVITSPPAASRWRTSSEIAGVGQGLSVSQTGRAGGADGFGDGCGDAVGGVAVVVADEDALARVFAADHVAGDGGGDGARVREGKIFGDDAAPSVGAKLNRNHCIRVYARRPSRQRLGGVRHG